MPTSGLAFCLSEDRESHEAGLRLAVLSLVKHSPETPVFVYKPESSAGFGAWVKQFSQVRWIPQSPAGSHSWNCKPQALMPLLAEGFRDAVWVDADIIVTRDCRPIFHGLDENVLVVAQEPASLPFQGTAVRTRAWNLGVKRSLPFTLNSSVLRVTRRHIPMLEHWTELLNDARYLATQKLPLEDRPIHMAGDQDILNALVGAADSNEMPLRVVRSAVEIIHAGGALGYSLGDRLGSLVRAKPTFLHATAGKPWLWFSGEPYWSQQNFFSWQRRLLQETSPYLFEARRYRHELGLDWNWMYPRTVTGTLLRLAGLGHFALRGLPITAAATIIDAVGNRSRPANAAAVDGGVPVFGRRQ